MVTYVLKQECRQEMYQLLKAAGIKNEDMGAVLGDILRFASEKHEPDVTVPYSDIEVPLALFETETTALARAFVNKDIPDEALDGVAAMVKQLQAENKALDQAMALEIQPLKEKINTIKKRYAQRTEEPERLVRELKAGIARKIQARKERQRIAAETEERQLREQQKQALQTARALINDGDVAGMTRLKDQAEKSETRLSEIKKDIKQAGRAGTRGATLSVYTVLHARIENLDEALRCILLVNSEAERVHALVQKIAIRMHRAGTPVPGIYYFKSEGVR